MLFFWQVKKHTENQNFIEKLLCSNEIEFLAAIASFVGSSYVNASDRDGSGAITLGIVFTLFAVIAMVCVCVFYKNILVAIVLIKEGSKWVINSGTLRLTNDRFHSKFVLFQGCGFVILDYFLPDITDDVPDRCARNVFKCDSKYSIFRFTVRLRTRNRIPCKNLL